MQVWGVLDVFQTENLEKMTGTGAPGAPCAPYPSGMAGWTAGAPNTCPPLQKKSSSSQAVYRRERAGARGGGAHALCGTRSYKGDGRGLVEVGRRYCSMQCWKRHTRAPVRSHAAPAASGHAVYRVSDAEVRCHSAPCGIHYGRESPLGREKVFFLSLCMR